MYFVGMTVRPPYDICMCIYRCVGACREMLPCLSKHAGEAINIIIIIITITIITLISLITIVIITVMITTVTIITIVTERCFGGGEL